MAFSASLLTAVKNDTKMPTVHVLASLFTIAGTGPMYGTGRNFHGTLSPIGALVGLNVLIAAKMPVRFLVSRGLAVRDSGCFS